jgi:hypothetical protein
MSALLRKADIRRCGLDVGKVPQADIDPISYARIQAGFDGYAIISRQ